MVITIEVIYIHGDNIKNFSKIAYGDSDRFLERGLREMLGVSSQPTFGNDV